MPKFALRLSGHPFRRFLVREDGSLLVFGLFLFASFFLMGGIAVDVMRAENKRTAMSQALDRCALNAAALRQTLDPETVVRDCVDRVGLLPQLTDVNVTNSAGQRSVEAIGDYELETFFMGASGVEEIELNARSVAEQRATNIEIAMVLDVSGSMNSNNRLSGLKTAARNFVSTVLANNTNKISITMVPYNGQVNLGSALAAKYNIANQHGLAVTPNGDMRHVHCVDMPSSVYNNTGISRTLQMQATGWADAFSTMAFEYGSNMSDWPTTYSSTSRAPNAANVWCPPSNANIVRMPDDNITNLHTYINNLTAIGATSINAGMKWGGALLDPQARSVINEFEDAGIVPEEFRDRPFDYTKRDALKIILLLSDGENFGDVRINDSYRTGLSPIFKGTDNNYSIQHTTGRPTAAGTNQFWVPHRNSNAGEWRATSWGGSTSTQGTQMTWQQVWQEMRVSYVAWHFYARALGTNSTTRNSTYTTWWNNFRTQRGDSASTPAMDAELTSICNQTKQQGVLVYSVAFSAPTRGVTALRSCASSDGHFFHSTNNTALNAAFQAIATNITQLRLVN
ncbi:MAG: pilus assembly protein TadG-related protein [Rhodobacteraceae bacterium]|nr:pilus assembly protein TadG-related protein [Paracoccaceae bacterium]